MGIRSFLIIFLLIFQASANESQINKNDILEIYFDMPNLYLLKNNASLKYQAERYLSKKKKNIKYNESIVYISKSNKKHIFKVKHYNSVESIEEKHPLLSLVKRKERTMFIGLLKSDGIKYPMKLKYVLENNRYSKEKEEGFNSYAILFDKIKNENKLFSVEFQYPYFLHLFYAMCFGLAGLIVMKIFFNKRLKGTK